MIYIVFLERLGHSFFKQVNFTEIEMIRNFIQQKVEKMHCDPSVSGSAEH
jgi:hypothetical protein